MIGLTFAHCNTFGLSLQFDNCKIDHSNFYKLKLNKTIFKKCSLKDVDFTDALLKEAKFYDCDLQQAVFFNTDLEKADLGTSYHLQIVPEQNKLKKTKFSNDNIRGLVAHLNIIID